MNAMLARSLSIAAVLLLPAHALAHAVSCEKTVGVVVTGESGDVVLGDDHMPVFLGGTSAILKIDHYPVVIGWHIEVKNLAADTSIVQSFLDPMQCSATDVFGTLPTKGTAIAAGESTHAVVLVKIDSFEKCLAFSTKKPSDDEGSDDDSSSNEGKPSDEDRWESWHSSAACRDVRENFALVTTERDVAQCRAKIVCKPEKTEREKGE